MTAAKSSIVVAGVVLQQTELYRYERRGRRLHIDFTQVEEIPGHPLWYATVSTRTGLDICCPLPQVDLAKLVNVTANMLREIKAALAVVGDA